MLEHLSLLPPASVLSEQECFEKFVPLAARVTNLRTILQFPEIITREEAIDWVADIDSVMTDFMTLLDHTREHVKKRLNAPTTTPNQFL
jgi:hypothetical protein